MFDPPPPQVCPLGQLPQLRVPPHPLEMVPHAPAGQLGMGVHVPTPHVLAPAAPQV